MINTVEKIYNLENVFCGYKVILIDSSILNFVPLDEANTDYQAIQEWVAIEGNTVIDNPPE